MKAAGGKKTSPNRDENASSTEDEDTDSYSGHSSSESGENHHRRRRPKKAPQFSVLRSDSDGLRMKISAIRNKKDNITVSGKNSSLNNNNHTSGKNDLLKVPSSKRKLSATSSSSCCSVCTRSESESSSEVVVKEKSKKIRIKRKKSNNDATAESTDSECGSKIGKPKDLFSHLTPLKNNNDPISSIEKITSHNNEVLPGGCISSSDTELPALVNAAIKCVESGSDTENSPVEPSKQYTSTLLHDFMIKTQMLGSGTDAGNVKTKSALDGLKLSSTSTTIITATASGSAATTPTIEDNKEVVSDSPSSQAQSQKKKRGRPKKTIVVDKVTTASSINESADSGITSTAQSLSPSPNTQSRRHNIKNSSTSLEIVQNGVPEGQKSCLSLQKINIASLDKQMYATERVLYPPRGKKKSTAKQNSRNNNSRYIKDDVIDPLWKKIDVNTKFRRPSLTGYKSDGGNTVCSKILAAKSGYVSDYGSVGNKAFSGYKSDVSGKSRSSMRSCVSRAKSCVFRCDVNSGRNRKLRRKRRALLKDSKSFGNVNDQDILQLAGLSLGQSSEESSRESLSKPIICNSQSKKYGEINRFVRTGEYFGRGSKKPNLNNSSTVDTTETLTENITFGKGNLFTNKLFQKSSIRCQTPSKDLDFSTNEFDKIAPKIRSRRSSAISRCSSLSVSSRFDMKRRRRRRPKYKFQSRSGPMDSKLNTEIEILANSFPALCRINCDRIQHTKDKEKVEKEKVSNSTKNLTKRNLKKRKLSENVEHYTTSTMLKRRHKKTGHTSPDEHKLPLKKRHYLLTPGEKSDSKSPHHLIDIKSKDLTEAKSTGKYSSGSNAKVTTKAVTPKKRHLLESSNNTISEEISSSILKSSNSPLSTDLKPTITTIENESETVAQKSSNQIKNDTITKKKRLEGLVSRIQAAETSSNSKSSPQNVSTTVIATTSTESVAPAYPPPGIFEPSIELEIQIPLPKLVANIVTKSEVDSPKLLCDSTDFDRSFPEPKVERVVETLLNKTGGSLLLKRKRRKTFNRTGFPTVKKRKRKRVCDVSPTNSDNDNKIARSSSMNILNQNTIQTKETDEMPCDRVPRIGETSATFLERNNKQPRLSVVSLERLQDPNKRRGEIFQTTIGTTPNESTEKLSTKLWDKLQSDDEAIRKIGVRNRREIAKLTELSGPSSDNEPLINIIIQRRRNNVNSTSRTDAIQKPGSEDILNQKSQENVTNLTAKKCSTTKVFKSDDQKQKNLSNFKDITSNGSLENLKKETDTKTRTRSRNKSVIQLDKSSQEINEEHKNVQKAPVIALNKIIEAKRVSQRSSSKNAKMKDTTAINNSKQVKSLNKISVSNVAVLKKSPTARKECQIEFTPDVENLEQEPLPLNEGPSPVDSELNRNLDVKSKKVTKWKKTYLTAGLLSDVYKIEKSRKSSTNDKLERQDSVSSVQSITGLTTPTVMTTQPKGLLPPPPYCEKFFRKTFYDFTLPYDIWWAHTNSKLHSRITVPSWNYKKIRTNVYGDVRPNPVFDHQACNCKSQSACGDDCLNRMVYTECSPANCPCGDKCQNQKIQKHDIAPGIERFMTENKGWGVRTTMSIRKGTYILEYVGEVVTEKEFKERMATLYVNDTHHYCLHLDGGLVIDGHRMGSDGRFVNHSCLPNCEMQKWSVNGLFRMALFALRNIYPGEELTYDYNFALFNPSEGQPCRCETPQCRGVIGGKSQRVKPLEQKVIETQPLRHGRPRKRQAKKNSGRFQSKDVIVPQFQLPSDREKKIIKAKNCFLVRNLEKVRKIKMKACAAVKNSEMPARPLTPSSLATQISALRVPRSIKTRGLTQAAHFPEVEKMAKMAVILREICTELESLKDDTGKSQLAKLLPASKKKRSTVGATSTTATVSGAGGGGIPSNDQKERTNGTRIIDFATIQANVEKGFYKEANLFDEDMNLIFSNALSFFETNSDEACTIDALLKSYNLKKDNVYDKLAELVDEKTLKNFRPFQEKIIHVKNPKEDIIRCICGLFKDEGLMIQCSKCLVWQHAECTKADINADNYACERCENRIVDFEIPLEEFTEEGYRYYLSLLRGDLQVRQGDTVYVLRDIPIKDENGKELSTNKKHTYETIGKIEYSECDIFRVERLWKNDDGKRFIFGHHYLRPHETFHEPTRKFYVNEVVRVPLYEVVPIELVIARCWVLDRGTFCKGRPVDCLSEKHVYICELRVDKSARFFSKAKQAYPTCTKTYAFRKFKELLKISRSYAPHEVDPSLLKPKKRKVDEPTTTQNNNSNNNNNNNPIQIQPKKTICPIIQLIPPPPKTINEKRTRLEGILRNLRINQGNLTPPIDLSYLLTGRGARQRRANNNAAIVPI